MQLPLLTQTGIIDLKCGEDPPLALPKTPPTIVARARYAGETTAIGYAD
jgi:hypothetical protein